MSSAASVERPPAAAGVTAFQSPSNHVAYLEQALWKQFSDAGSQDEFAQAWLALQCRYIVGTHAAVVVLKDAEAEGPFRPVAFWPDRGLASSGLMATAELALSERRGVVDGAEHGSPAGRGFAAYPFMVDGEVQGCVALELAALSESALRDVVRQLRWGTGWVETLIRREQGGAMRSVIARSDIALKFLGTALEEERFRDTATAIVTELALSLGCDQVSVGMRRNGRVKVVALSHSADVAGRMGLVRMVGAAMDEAVDQGSILVYPPREEWDYRILAAHADLAKVHGPDHILTIPLQAQGRIVGALTFERSAGAGFDQAAIELCDTVAAVVGPILEQKRRDDRLIVSKVAESAAVQTSRLFGAHYLGRKLVALGLLLATLFLALATGEYRVTANATIEGAVQRVVLAPLDGYIATQQSRAGSIIRAGDPLASFDDKDLRLELLKWVTTRQQRQAEYDKALASYERADIGIIQAQLAQVEAQIALLETQIARSVLRAPFDALVVSGDLSQSIGASVRRGDELFKVAPLDSYRVVIDVDERQIADVAPGQTGWLIIAALPDEPQRYTVEHVTPVTRIREGVNVFRVEATLEKASPRLRPGMEGIAKTRADERLYAWIWTRSLIDWARIAMWKWIP